MESLDARPRFEAQLLDERPARRLIDVERFGLPTRAVESQHQLAAQPLSQWVPSDERFELTDKPRVTAQC